MEYKQAIIDAVIKELVEVGGTAILAYTYTNDGSTVTDFSYMEAGKRRAFEIRWQQR